MVLPSCRPGRRARDWRSTRPASRCPGRSRRRCRCRAGRRSRCRRATRRACRSRLSPRAHPPTQRSVFCDAVGRQIGELGRVRPPRGREGLQRRRRSGAWRCRRPWRPAERRPTSTASCELSPDHVGSSWLDAGPDRDEPCFVRRSSTSTDIRVPLPATMRVNATWRPVGRRDGPPVERCGRRAPRPRTPARDGEQRRRAPGAIREAVLTPPKATPPGSGIDEGIVAAS